MWSVPTHLPRPPVPAQSSAPLGKHPWLCTGHRGTVAQSRPLKDTLMGAHLPPLLAGQGSRGSRKPAHCTQAQLHKDKGLGVGEVSVITQCPGEAVSGSDTISGCPVPGCLLLPVRNPPSLHLWPLPS